MCIRDSGKGALELSHDLGSVRGFGPGSSADATGLAGIALVFFVF
jgi:hypothetical protein